jgi:hypothetical protein
MLAWIKGFKSDHPLDDKEGGHLLLEGLQGKDSVTALEELSSYLDQVKTAQGLAPQRAYEIVDLLDRTGRSHYRKLNQLYVSETHRLTKFQQSRTAGAVGTFCQQLGDGYRLCLAKYEVGALGAGALRQHLPRITSRALRAYGGQLKWSLLHYGPSERRIWEGLGQLYVAGQSLGFLSEPLTLYRGSAAQTSTQQELLKVLMLAVSAPDGLLPIQVDIAERLITRCAPNLACSRQAADRLHYIFDLASGQPPGRLARISGLPASTLYFGPGAAARQVQELIEFVERNDTVPADFPLGSEHSVDRVEQTLRHLARYWSRDLPERKQRRRRHVETVSVVHEFEEVVANAGGLFLESPFVSNEEDWTIEDESEGGFGAVVREPQGQWVRVGQIIGIRRDEGVTWAVGVVRRVSSDEEGNRRIGVQVLSSGGAAVTVLPAKLADRDDDTPPDGEICVLLSSCSMKTGEAMLLMRPGLFRRGRPLEMRAYDRSYLLSPLGLADKGEDFEVVRFRIGEPAAQPA